MRPQMAARPVHLFEAGVITEQRLAGLAEAPAALGPAIAERLGCEKRVRIPFVPRDRLLTAARDAGEIGNLERSRVLRVPFDADRADAPGLVAFARRKRVWIHVDIDVVDPREFPAVSFPAPRGPSLAALREVLRTVASVADVCGFELCAYDPRKDRDGTLVAPLVDVVSELMAPVAI